MSFENAIGRGDIPLIPVVIAGLIAWGTVPAHTSRRFTVFLKYANDGVDFSLLFSGKLVPPPFELVGEFDLPGHTSIIPWKDYAVKGIEFIIKA